MLRYKLLILAIAAYIELTAQTTASADTIYLATYNTGMQFQLKRAPFGEKKPKLEVVTPMVFAEDSIEVKNKEVVKNFQPPTIAQLRIKASENDRRGANPQRPSQSEIDKMKANKGKRTCTIYTKNLKGNIVLLDFDKGCDPSFKCLQAQRAGANGVIVISDSDKKDSIALEKGKYADSLRIPCFSITRSQGDSLRFILPSQVALFVPQRRSDNDLSLLASNEILLQQQNQSSHKVGDAKSAIGEQDVFNLNQPNQPLRFALTPNPSNTEARLEYAFSEPTALTIKVLNEAGQTMKIYQRLQTQTESIIFQTTDWVNGFYIIRLTTPNTQVIKRLVVHH